jgi:anti-sigma B factor antagonist/stage II sporulation protein AA (anti-sigma F factor antagonist)
MDAIERFIENGVVIEKVNLSRATMNEAYEIKDNLIDDIIDQKKIIVDLTDCEYIDSTFLGALIYAYRKIKEQNGIIALVLSDTFLSKSFMYKEISSIFQVHFSLREAIAELSVDNKEAVTEKF